MKRAIAARPRISERTWLLLILPLLWLLVIAVGHSQDDAGRDPSPISTAGKDAQ